MPRHSPLLRRCYHHLAEATKILPLSIAPRLARLPLFSLRHVHLRLSVIFRAIWSFSALMNITSITKRFPWKLSIYQRHAMCRHLFTRISRRSTRLAKVAERELIAVRYLTKYARAYNWILFMDFIQNVYRYINYKRRGRKAREDRPSPFDSRSRPDLPLLSSWVMNVPNYILKAVLH